MRVFWCNDNFRLNFRKFWYKCINIRNFINFFKFFIWCITKIL